MVDIDHDPDKQRREGARNEMAADDAGIVGADRMRVAREA
jgi:hypothetical protein